MRAQIISMSLVAAFLLAGCDALQPAGTTPTQSDTPVAQATATTAAPASPTAAPATATSAANATTAPATAAATAATTGSPALPTGQPTSVKPTVAAGQPQTPEAILILNPGSNSSVNSLVRVTGEADPTFEQNLVIQITDANGTVISTQPTTIKGVGATRGPFEAQVAFTVGAQGPGRSSVYSTSARDGGLIHLASVDVTLLTGCCAEPVVGQVHNETHAILEPAPLAKVAGGSLHVAGFSDYVFEAQLSLALCGGGGSGASDKVCGTADNLLATGAAALNAPDVGQAGPFAGDLSYHVSATTQARWVVYSRSARDGGIVHLSTVPVQLTP